MKATFIFGHKKPDTDSVCSAIALSDLMNKLGNNTIPRIIGDLNSETKFVLNYFNVPVPRYLNDVRLQIRDVSYGKGLFCYDKDSLYDVIQYLRDNHLSSIPLVNSTNHYIGLLSMKNIANVLISWDYDIINTSYDNIIKTLNGRRILRFDDEIKGNVLVASYRSTTFINTVELGSNDILIVGDRHSIIENAIEKGVKLIIITGNNLIKQKHIEMAKKRHVNIIKTPLRTFNVIKVIGMCNYAKTLCEYDNIKTFSEFDYIRDFNEEHNKLRHKVYPIVNRHGECLGLIQPSDINNKVRKKVFLVDHNEKEQSVDGLDDAEIVGIIDHHKLGTIGTIQPINFRTMTVGCTATIIYQLYQSSNVSIPKNIAGLLLSAIISDTLLFRSPTTSEEDIKAAHKLARIGNINIDDYAIKMFKAGSSIKGKTMQEVLFADLKDYNEGDYKLGLAQINTLNIDEIKSREEELIEVIEKESRLKDFDILAFFITDIINEASYVYYSEKSKNILEKAFDIEKIEQGYYLPKIVSRKKQILPNILNIIDEN